MDDKAKKITIAQAVTLSNNRMSISAQQKLGTAITKARKEAQAVARREYNTAVTVVAQDDVDEEFARQVEEAVRKRGEDLARLVSREQGNKGTPTPAVRNKRKRKAPERYNPPLREKRAKM